LDPQVANNLNIFDTVFGKLHSFSMKYEPKDYHSEIQPTSQYYLNTNDMLKSTDTMGVVLLKIGKLVKTGSPIAHSAYLRKYIPYELQLYTIDSCFNYSGGLYEIIFTLKIPANIFNQRIMDAYQDVFNSQFTEVLEDELSKGN